MSLLSNIVINSFSLMILIIIFIYSKNYDNINTQQNRIFNFLLCFTAFLLVIDILSRLDGKTAVIFIILNHIGNFLMFLFSPIPSSIWVLFVCSYTNRFSKKQRWIAYTIIIIINIMNAVMLILSQNYKWFYYIDSDNIYHRGSLFYVSPVFTIALLALALILLIADKKEIENKHYSALLFFVVPPFICMGLQILFYGISFILSGIVLSILIIFLYIQNQALFTDYLTKVSNRKKLELYLHKKISYADEENTFSSIMIDLDGFKKINDTFGHKTGDEVLQITAELLKDCIRPNDFIARYGGDEFCILLETSDIQTLEKIVQRIENHIEKYNETSNLPYKIKLSMGYAIYKQNMNADEFQNMVDKLMYENKLLNKEKL